MLLHRTVFVNALCRYGGKAVCGAVPMLRREPSENVPPSLLPARSGKKSAADFLIAAGEMLLHRTVFVNALCRYGGKAVCGAVPMLRREIISERKSDP